MPEPSRETPHGETPYSPMSLLRALTSSPLDVDELRGTEEDSEADSHPDTPASRVVTLVIAILLGLAVAVAVTNLRADAVSEDSPRAALEQEVQDSRERAVGLEQRQEDLQSEISALQEDVLQSSDSAAAARLSTYETATASTALSGSGVVLQVEDSAPLPASPGVAEGTVNRATDEDLQIAVNGLWAAGAEAIAVNGQRISASSAIRTAGSAVLVDLRPLSPPYRIVALGDGAAIEQAVQGEATGEYLSEISSRFGIVLSWETSEDLSVPARAPAALREASATPPEETGDAADGTDTAGSGATDADTPPTDPGADPGATDKETP